MKLKRWSGYPAALLGIGLMSGLAALAGGRENLVTAAMAYLAVVLAAAVWFGRGPAAVAAVTAGLTFNFLFTEPYYSLHVTQPSQLMALAVFLATAMVTGQLAAGERERAEDARRREREAVILYEVVGLLAGWSLPQALEAIAARLREELELAAVIVRVRVPGGGPSLQAQAGDPAAVELAQRAALADRVLGTRPPVGQAGRGPGRWIKLRPPRFPGQRRLVSQQVHLVPVESRGERVGGIALVRELGAPRFRLSDDRLLAATAVQLGAALERDRLRQEATTAEVLRRTDQLKTALLNAVSHDLRTPLASIVASAGSLLQEDITWTAEERQEFAQTIDREARRLNQIIGNLLDLSRIEAGSLRPQRDWYDLGTLVNEVVGRLRGLTAGRPVLVDVPDDLPPVLFDYVEIDQVLTNLVENALRHTPPGTEVRVSARVTGDVVQVEVVDCGPGVPADALPSLFKPFSQAVRPGARGAGLGLAVAKGLVEAHGGQLCAQNRKEGGARFCFTLPLADPAALHPGTLIPG